VPSAAEVKEIAAFAELIDACVAAIVRDEDWQRFTHFLEEMLLAGKLPQLPAEPEAARMLACALGRAIWNATPLPGNGFRPRLIPAPGRNDRCLVGLGCKHKHCCGGAPGFPRISSDEIWVSLGKALPATTLRAAAAAGKLPPAALGAAARRLVDGGDPEAAKRLLEPLFRGALEAFDERHEEALDALCDAYGMLDEPRKKQALLERVARTASPALRVPALQRLATVLSDAGRHGEAWAAFRDAQRLEPDDPGLSSLEVTMLLAEGRGAEAAERAAFWSRRLRRLGYDDPTFLGHLDTLAKGGGAGAGEAFLKIAGEAPNRLHAWLARQRQRRVPSYRVNAPAPLDAGDEEAFTRGVRQHLLQLGVSKAGLNGHLEALRRQLGDFPKRSSEFESRPRELEDGADSSPGSMGAAAVLIAPAPLDATEEAWRKVYPHGKPLLVSLAIEFARDPWGEGFERWLGFLETHDEAFDSLDILDDIATALDAHPLLGSPWLREELLDPLLARAAAIVDAALAARAGAVLPWAMPDNRPALRLLVRRAYRQLDTDDPNAAESLRRILALNPTDNHGLRAPLVNLLLRRGQDDDALELIGRYAADLDPAIRFGAVLAWYRKGELQRAARELEEAMRDMPLVPGHLIPARKAEPELSKLGVTAGGPDEAWLYRAEMREVWAGVPGLLDWLKRAAR